MPKLTLTCAIDNRDTLVVYEDMSNGVEISMFNNKEILCSIVVSFEDLPKLIEHLQAQLTNQ